MGLRCMHYTYIGGKPYIYCGRQVNLLFSMSARKKLCGSVIVNENRVMFASEYKHFLESFNEKLKKAIWMYDN